MTTTITIQLIYAVVPYRNKCKTTKVIREQIFAVRDDGIKDHLIGNIYSDPITTDIIDIIKEKRICNMEIKKSSFFH